MVDTPNRADAFRKARIERGNQRPPRSPNYVDERDNLETSFSTPTNLLGASSEDTWQGETDELGRKIYVAPSGRKYSVGSSAGSRSLPQVARDVYEAIPPMEDWRMPTGQEVASGAKAVAKGAYEGAKHVIETPTNPDATLGDVYEVAGSMALGAGVGVAAGAEVPEGAIGAFLGRPAGYKPKAVETSAGPQPPPRPGLKFGELFKRNNPTTEIPSQLVDIPAQALFDARLRLVRNGEELDEFLTSHGATVNPENVSFISDLWDMDFEGLPDVPEPSKSYANFRSPTLEAVSGVDTDLMDTLPEEWPSKGMKGSTLLKELQDNPAIRNSEVKSLELDIDPNKRYTREEVTQLVQSSQWDVEARSGGTSYRNTQRQPVLDPEIDYDEIIITASRPDKPAFKGKGTHHTPDTIAHTRISTRKSPDGNYVLVEEMQSDLLQHGYEKPKKADTLDRDAFWKDRVTSSTRELSPELLEEFRGLVESGARKTGRDFEDRASAYFLKKYQEERQLAPKATLPENATVDELDLDFIPDADFEFNYNLDSPEEMAENRVTDLLSDFGYYREQFTYFSEKNNPAVSAPPVTSTTESTRSLVQGILAYAQKNYVDNIVFPSLEKIAAQRFAEGGEEYLKAIKPGSGFHNTYVTSLNKVITELQNEFGPSGITVSSRPLKYEAGGSITPNTAYFETRAQLRDNVPFSFDLDELKGVENYLVGRSDELAPREDSIYEALGRIYPGATRESFQSFWAEEVPGSSAKIAISEWYASLMSKVVDPEIAEGIQINIGNIKNYDLSKPKFAEGGVVMDPEMMPPPGAGNEVPPGAMPKEVADDQPILASEGEYIIPANVVRYLGLDYIEKIVNKAKKGLEEMDQNGRIGGEPSAPAPAPEPAPTVPMMAEGGMVGSMNVPTTPAVASGAMGTGQGGSFSGVKQMQGPGGNIMYVPFLDGKPIIPVPDGYTEVGGVASSAPKASKPVASDPLAATSQYQDDGNSTADDDKERAASDAQMKGSLAGDPRQWTADTFVKYGNTLGSDMDKVGRIGVQAMMPGIGTIAVRARDRFLKNNVPNLMEDMLKTGKDPLGNAITPEQKAALQAAQSKIASSYAAKPAGNGLMAKIGNVLGLNRDKPDTPDARVSSSDSATPSTRTSAPAARTSSDQRDKPTSTRVTSGSMSKPSATADKAASSRTAQQAPPSRTANASKTARETARVESAKKDNEKGVKRGFAKGGVVAPVKMPSYKQGGLVKRRDDC
jgi:hypothetical protein